jgi:hypothetical protein
MSASTRLCMANKDYVPPKGFTCECPAVGGKVISDSLPDLVEACSNHIVSKGQVPPVDLYSLVQDSLCRSNLGWKFCVPCQKTTARVSAGAVIRWIKAMFKFAKAGFTLVSQEEAERRAEICAGCPLQVATPAMCWGCHGIAGLLPMIAGSRKTRLDSKLEACSVCGCFNSVAVHIPLDCQESKGEYPPHCWKRKS